MIYRSAVLIEKVEKRREEENSMDKFKKKPGLDRPGAC